MPEQIKEILQLRGVNLRQEAADVEEPESRKLVNLDPFQRPGALVIRRGRSVLGGPLADDLVRAVARINSIRYQVAGRRLYREFIPITGPYLAENKKTSFTAFRPLDDSVTWAFIADDDFMLKSDATRLYQWGIDPPLSPDPKVANQTGVTPGDTIATGTYKIAVTQLRYDHTLDV
jgi:hypothetical protein